MRTTGARRRAPRRLTSRRRCGRRRDGDRAEAPADRAGGGRRLRRRRRRGGGRDAAGERPRLRRAELRRRHHARGPRRRPAPRDREHHEADDGAGGARAGASGRGRSSFRAQATRIGESTLFLRPGERLTVRELAIGALVPSANDAATALALHVADGSLPRFVALMNAKARALGLRGTHFANPHGLDQPGNYSTARDVVRLLARRAPRAVHPDAGRGGHGRTVAGRNVETTDDLLGQAPVARRRQDGSYRRGGLVAGRRRLGARRHGDGRRARRGLARSAQRRSRGAAPLGPAAVRPRARGRSAAHVRRSPTRAGGSTRCASGRRGRSCGRPRCGARWSSASSRRRCSRCPCDAGSRSARCASTTATASSRALRSSPTATSPTRGFGAKAGFVARRTVHHLAGLVS